MLKNEVVLVTGGGGIGQASAQVFGNRGAKAVVDDRDGEATGTVAKFLQATTAPLQGPVRRG